MDLHQKAMAITINKDGKAYTYADLCPKAVDSLKCIEDG